MRGIPEELLNKKYASLTNEVYLFNAGRHEMLKELMQECQELQEPWMTLEEFLESGFEGWCWIVEITREPATLSYFDSDGVFSGTSGLIVFNEEFITHVMPIHKPEPPR